MKEENRKMNISIQEQIPPTVGESVIVRYKVGKKINRYVGIVTGIEGMQMNITFLKAINASKTIFVLKDNDSSWETLENYDETKIPFTINNRGSVCVLQINGC